MSIQTHPNPVRGRSLQLAVAFETLPAPGRESFSDHASRVSWDGAKLLDRVAQECP